MILPDINEFTAIYASNPCIFLEVGEDGRLVQQVLKYGNNNNTTTTGSNNNDVNNNQMLLPPPATAVMSPNAVDMNDSLPAYQPPGGF
eukprot:UN10546